MREKLRGKSIILGVIDLSTPKMETAEPVADRIRRALPHVDVDKVIFAPDCGIKYLPRVIACEEMQAVVKGAALVRAERL